MKERNIILDNFRGIAVLLVLFHHLTLINKDAFQNIFLKLLRYSMTFIVRGGWCGVDLFFVLSGFLISGLIYNEYKSTGKFKVGQFLIRRGFKLYPSFFFFILFAFFIERVVIHDHTFNGTDYLKDALFLRNYLGGRFGHTWSLDVEEHFYILLSLFFLYLITKKYLNSDILIKTYVVLLTISLACRILSYFILHDHSSFYYTTHTRIDCLFFGVLLSYLYFFEKSRLNFIFRRKKLFTIVSLLIIASNFTLKWETNPLALITLSANSVCFGVLMLIALETDVKWLKNNFLSFIGKNSYAIYLWHPFINSYLLLILFSAKIDAEHVDITSKKTWVLYILLYYTCSIITGTLLTTLIEIPFLKLRNKLFPSKARIPLVQ